MFTRDLWLSELLGKPVYQLTGDRLAIDARNMPQGGALVWTKLAVDRVDKLLYLQNLGFRVIEANVQFATSSRIDNGAVRIHSSLAVRPAVPADEPSVRAVARSSFDFDRFHRDPQIRAEQASRIKEEWAANFFSGKRGSWMLVAEEEERLCGFVQLMSRDNDTVVIDLIAVSSESRGRGVAKAMIGAAMANYLRRDASMYVGTQLANSPSIGLYQQLGFRLVSASYVLHLHVPEIET